MIYDVVKVNILIREQCTLEFLNRSLTYGPVELEEGLLKHDGNIFLNFALQSLLRQKYGKPIKYRLSLYGYILATYGVGLAIVTLKDARLDILSVIASHRSGSRAVSINGQIGAWFALENASYWIQLMLNLWYTGAVSTKLTLTVAIIWSKMYTIQYPMSILNYGGAR